MCFLKMSEIERNNLVLEQAKVNAAAALHLQVHHQNLLLFIQVQMNSHMVFIANC